MRGQIASRIPGDKSKHAGNLGKNDWHLGQRLNSDFVKSEFSRSLFWSVCPELASRVPEFPSRWEAFYWPCHVFSLTTAGFKKNKQWTGASSPALAPPQSLLLSPQRLPLPPHLWPSLLGDVEVLARCSSSPRFSSVSKTTSFFPFPIPSHANRNEWTWTGEDCNFFLFACETIQWEAVLFFLSRWPSDLWWRLRREVTLRGVTWNISSVLEDFSHVVETTEPCSETLKTSPNLSDFMFDGFITCKFVKLNVVLVCKLAKRQKLTVIAR